MSPGKERALCIGLRVKQKSIMNSYPLPLQWTGKRGEQTLSVNAAYMTGNNKPENPPWLIRLDLARG